MDLAPLVAAIGASGLSLSELDDRQGVYAWDIERILDGDVEISEITLWRLADRVRVDPEESAVAGWPERVVGWLRCARIGESGFEAIGLDDGLAPGHYFVGTADPGTVCILRWSEVGSAR